LGKKLRFEVSKFEIDSKEINSVDESQFVDADIEAFSSGQNLHELNCSVDVLKKTAHTIYEKPVVFELDKNFYDFNGHPENEEKRSIGGFIVPDSAEFFERPDGRTTLKVKAKIWKLYAQSFIDVFKFGGKDDKSVSVEMLMEDPTEKNEMTSFAYTAVCVLGDFVTPASPDARMQLLSFSDKEKEGYKKAFQAEFARYSSIDFAIPENVKSNCRDGLEIRDEFGAGGTSVSLAMARFLIDNDNITPERARKVFKYFSAKGRVKPDDNTGKDWVSWQLYGGEAAKEWANKIVDEMGVVDESIASYFEKFPAGDNADGREENHTNMSKKIKEEEFESKDEAKDEDVYMEEETPKSDEMAEDEEEVSDEEMAEDEEPKSEDMESNPPSGNHLELLEEEGDPKEEDMGLAFEQAMEKVETLEADVTRLEAENQELAKFKAEVEKDNFEFKIGEILEVVKSSFTDEELETAKEDALENFTLETMGLWANSLKATAFEKGNVRNVSAKEKDDGIVKIGIPNQEKPKKKKGLWLQ